jgi:GTP-binding protein YchF
MIVPDRRLAEIDKIVHAAKVTPATVEMVDIPGLAKGGTGPGTQFLAEIRNVDALIHVIRCFDDPLNPHPEGSVNPVRDRETIDLELQVRDIESIDKKLSRLDKASRTGDKDARHGIEVLHTVKTHLESFKPVRTAPALPENRKYFSDLFLLSDKPVLYVCNVDDASATSGNRYSSEFNVSAHKENAEVMILAAKLEADIAEFDNPEDREVFLTDAGLSEPGINRLVRAAYHLLDLRTFFTAGPKEVRAWTIHRGMTAAQAAGVIHSDLERGFIRAEVIGQEEFVRLGSEHACRDAGKLFVEGRNYIVDDGDILHIRFNV